MATPARRCLICGKSLAGRGAKAKTCSPAHAKALSRRRLRERENARTSAGRPADNVAEVRNLLNPDNGKTQDAIRDAFVEELRPVLREAIDQDTIRAIQGMVGLAAAAVKVLEQDLVSTDAVLRSKAAALVVKYTMGNALVTPPRADTGDKLVIINQLPRPVAIESTSDDIDEVSPIVDSDCIKRCDTCRLDKPCAEFPGDGPRCAQCMLERKESVIAHFLNPEERAGLLFEHAVPEPSAAADVQRQGLDGQSEVGQIGPGLQLGDVRPSGLVENRDANPAGFEAGSPQAWREALRPTASETFPGPPDPKRWSTGR